MTINRRRFAASAAATFAGVALLRSRADAAEFTLKYANNLALTHPMNVRAAEAAAAVKTETNGAVDIQIFPNNQLGNDTAMLTQLRSGAIDFYTNSGQNMSTVVPVTAINAVGFAFPSYDKVWAAMDGALGAHVRQAIAGVGLIAFEKMWDNGFREITNSVRAIATPADLSGLKMRVPPSPITTSLFKGLGASATPIDFGEVYTALQTHIVDGQENPLAIVETAKLYEVQKYVSMTNHMWDGYWFLANAQNFGKLPKNFQDIIQKSFNAAAEKDRVDVRALNDSLLEKLRGQGMLANSPKPAPFREALVKAGYYAQWKASFGPQVWSLLEQYSGALG